MAFLDDILPAFRSIATKLEGGPLGADAAKDVKTLEDMFADRAHAAESAVAAADEKVQAFLTGRLHPAPATGPQPVEVPAPLPMPAEPVAAAS